MIAVHDGYLKLLRCRRDLEVGKAGGEPVTEGSFGLQCQLFISVPAESSGGCGTDSRSRAICTLYIYAETRGGIGCGEPECI